MQYPPPPPNQQTPYPPPPPAGPVYGRPPSKQGGYAAAIPFLVLLAILVGVPLLMGTWISFLSYNPARGMSNSSFAGLQNYLNLFSGASRFGEAFWGSIGVQLGTALVSGLSGSLLALLVLQIKGRLLRVLACAALSVGLYPPATTLSLLVLQSGFLRELEMATTRAMLSYLLSTYALAFFVALGGAGLLRRMGKSPVQGVCYGFAVWMLLRLAGALQNGASALHPLTSPATGYFSYPSFSFGISYQQAQFSLGAAVDSIGNLYGALLFLGAALVCCCLFPRSQEQPDQAEKPAPKSGSSWKFLVPAGVIILLTGLALSTLRLAPLNGSAVTVLSFAIQCMLSAAACGGFALFVGRALGSSRGPGAVLLLILLCIGAGYSSTGIGNYMLMRNLGVINTIVPFVLTGMVNIPLILLAGLLYRSLGPAAISAPKLFGGFCTVQFLLLWSDHLLETMVYVTEKGLFSPSMTIYQLTLLNPFVRDGSIPSTLFFLALVGLGAFLIGGCWIDEALWQGEELDSSTVPQEPPSYR